MLEIKCTDPRHPEREQHADDLVRSEWNDGVLCRADKPQRAYSCVCTGCDRANKIDDVPETRIEEGPRELLRKLRIRVNQLEQRVTALEGA
jgi:hypothetical protein